MRSLLARVVRNCIGPTCIEQYKYGGGKLTLVGTTGRGVRDLLGTVQRELFTRSGVDPAEVGQVVGGCVHGVGMRDPGAAQQHLTTESASDLLLCSAPGRIRTCGTRFRNYQPS